MISRRGAPGDGPDGFGDSSSLASRSARRVARAGVRGTALASRPAPGPLRVSAGPCAVPRARHGLRERGCRRAGRRQSRSAARPVRLGSGTDQA